MGSQACVAENLQKQRQENLTTLSSSRPPSCGARGLMAYKLEKKNQMIPDVIEIKKVKHKELNPVRVGSNTLPLNPNSALFLKKEMKNQEILEMKTYSRLPPKSSKIIESNGETESKVLSSSCVFPVTRPNSFLKEKVQKKDKMVIIARFFDSRQVVLDFPRSKSIGELKEEIHKSCLTQYQIDEFLLLRQNQEQNLASLLENFNTDKLVLMVRLLHQQEPQIPEEENEERQETENEKTEQKDLNLETPSAVFEVEIIQPNLIVTTIEKPDHWMSCGHKISEQRMKNLIDIYVSTGRSNVVCPSCDVIKQWSMAQVKAAGYFTDEEITEISNKLCENSVSQTHQERPSSTHKRFQHYSDQNARSSSLTKKKNQFQVLTECVGQQDEAVQKKRKEKIIQVRVVLIAGKTANLQVQKTSTVLQLKMDLYRSHYSELYSQQTVITRNNVILKENKKMYQLKLSENDTLVQRVAELHEISGLIVDKTKEDPISCEKGMAKMNCGHWLSRVTVKGSIQAQICSSKWQITCPQVENKICCNKKWVKRQWVFVGGYTHAQMNQIDLKLSINWIKAHTKVCPTCKISISRNGLTSARVRCPHCNSIDICYSCLQPWKGSSDDCQNDVCKVLRQKVTNAPLDRQFTLYNQKTRKRQLFKVPIVRACPRCRTPVFNISGCKHTPCACSNWEYIFCFVCLRIKGKNGWPCGDYVTYCGFIADHQVFKT